MKIQAYKVESFIQSLPPQIMGVLLYGPDSGQVSLHAQTIASQITPHLDDPFAVANVDAEMLKESPAHLTDEMLAMSLMGGRKLVRLLHAPNGVGKVVSEALQDIPAGPESNFLLVTAGELPASSLLRKTFEQGEHLAALPCYQDDMRDLPRVIATQASLLTLALDQESIAYIAQHCQGDRMGIALLLQKIQLYVDDRPRATLEEVIACTASITEATLDDIALLVASGNKAALRTQLDKAQQQGIHAVAILRSLHRHFMRLLHMRLSMQQGMRAEEAIKAVRPMVFFKHVPIMHAQLQRWKDSAMLTRALSLLYTIEMTIKHDTHMQDTTLSRGLLKLVTMR